MRNLIYYLFMEKIIIKKNHPVFWKSEAEEFEILCNPSKRQELWEYICSVGLRHKKSQRFLAGSDDLEMIELQDYLHHSWWKDEARKILEKRGFMAPITVDQDGFKAWLSHSWTKSVNRYATDIAYSIANLELFGAGHEESSRLDDSQIISLLEQGNEGEIKKRIRQKLSGNTLLLFLQKAPLEMLFRYVQAFSLETDEQQCALLKRECDALTWLYANIYTFKPQAMKMIKASGNLPLWHTVIIQKYATQHNLVHKFGNIGNVHQRLTASFNRKYETQF